MTDKWGLPLYTEKQFATPELNLNPVYVWINLHSKSTIGLNYIHGVERHRIYRLPFINTASVKGYTRQRSDKPCIHTEERLRDNCILQKAINGSTLILILTMNGSLIMIPEVDVSDRCILTDLNPDLLDL